MLWTTLYNGLKLNGFEQALSEVSDGLLEPIESPYESSTFKSVSLSTHFIMTRHGFREILKHYGIIIPNVIEPEKFCLYSRLPTYEHEPHHLLTRTGNRQFKREFHFYRFIPRGIIRKILSMMRNDEFLDPSSIERFGTTVFVSSPIS